MENEDRRDLVGIGPLDEIDVLVLVLCVHSQADHVHAEGLKLAQLGVLILRAELQWMYEVDATDHVPSLCGRSGVCTRPDTSRDERDNQHRELDIGVLHLPLAGNFATISAAPNWGPQRSCRFRD